MTIYDTATGGIAALADRVDGQTPVSGVLIGEGDITEGLSGKRTRWPADILQDMVGVFDGKPITMASSDNPEQHVGVELTEDGPELTGAVSMDDKVGEISRTLYESGVGLLYEGFVADADAADAVEAGLAQVSPVVMRDVEPVEGKPDLFEVAEVFGGRDVAIVADGAVPSNKIQAGELPATAEALSTHFGPEYAEVLQRERARRPTYSTTEDAEWETPTLAEYLTSYDSLPDPADVDSVQDLTDEGRGLIADKSLLGTPAGETLREVRFFPVVNPETDALNRRALGAVRSGRGSQADIPADAESSAERMAGELLNEEFGAAVDIEAATNHPSGDDGSQGESSQSTSDTNDNGFTMDLTDYEQELVAAARQKDDPTVVESEVLDRLEDLEAQLSEHKDLIDEASDLDEPAVQEADEVAAMQERITIVEDMMAETLTDDVGLSEKAVDAMSFEAMAAHFEDDDGDLDVEALTQSPESGSGPTGGGGNSGPSDADLDRIDEIKTKLDHAEAALPDSRVEALREEAAELAGADSYDGALEVL